MTYQPVIGLEVHAQLSTASKIFSSSPTVFGSKPNTQANLVDLGMPGTLPVLNRKAVECAVRFGIAIEAEVARYSVFARKNYFYPDLPKGYQISQFELPIVGEGKLEIELACGISKTVGITRAHLEEDAGKSLHEEFDDYTAIDLNRAGTPLLEIVSEPEIYSAEEALAYAKKLHALVRYIGICDGNMQEGSFRMDVNISLRKTADERLGTRAEIKNLNSFKFMEKAIAYEIKRQTEILSTGGEVTQETRLYDVSRGITRSMRSKEESHDYRYFPCPDLLPLMIEDELLAKIKLELPELPQEKKNRYIKEYGLSPYQAGVITAARDSADYFEELVEHFSADCIVAANWVIGELAGALNRENKSIAESPISAENLAGLIKNIHNKTISGKIAKTVFEQMWNHGGKADDIIADKGLKQITDLSAIESLVDEVIRANPVQVEQYKNGKTKLMGFFVGQVMKESGGKANPAEVNKILNRKLA